MIKDLYYFHDCETSGLDPERNKIIQYYACLTDNQFNILEKFSNNEKDWLIKPLFCQMMIDLNAFKINKINLIKLLEEGVDEITFCNELNRFLREIKEKYPTNTIITAGHNVSFDNTFIKKSPFIVCDVLNTKAPLDTAVISRYLKLQNKLPGDLEISLTNLAKYFNIKNNGEHTAMGDTKTTIEVMRNLVKL